MSLYRLRIGDSAPAALFTSIVEPSDESRDIGVIKKEDSQRHQKRLAFWQQLKDNLKGKTNLHSNRKPTKDNWWGVSAGISGIDYNYAVKKDDSSIELYIGKGETEDNLQIFNALCNHKDEI